MKRNGWMHVVLGGALVLAAGTANAQGPGGGHHGPFGGPVELMGFEGMHGGKLVKGAPFSATSTSATTQVLQDGTTINRSAQGALYRDSEGRSRRELTFTGVGPLEATGGTHKMVAIFDPVAGVHYMLNPDKKVAHKMTLPANAGNADKAQAVQQKMQARRQQEEASGALKVESLGTQMVNGVNAEGTRTTHTIAAGEIGNDKPLQVVSERWYSPDLQTVVKSSRTDPRFGTTTFSLSNIQKAEPAAALFAVPADYTVKAGEPGHGHHGGPGAGAPAPPPAS
ncbi:MAG: hypothetical protein QOJ41_2666 [Acidobacteriaceae bacterium]|jgi:hypothetical protein|nr:hypothetical protein [Acidobacteriaceae bacterium]